jgi:hypothetical protein
MGGGGGGRRRCAFQHISLARLLTGHVAMCTSGLLCPVNESIERRVSACVYYNIACVAAAASACALSSQGTLEPSSAGGLILRTNTVAHVLAKHRCERPARVVYPCTSRPFVPGWHLSALGRKRTSFTRELHPRVPLGFDPHHARIGVIPDREENGMQRTNKPQISGMRSKVQPQTRHCNTVSQTLYQ